MRFSLAFQPSASEQDLSRTVMIKQTPEKADSLREVNYETLPILRRPNSRLDREIYVFLIALNRRVPTAVYLQITRPKRTSDEVPDIPLF